MIINWFLEWRVSSYVRQSVLTWRERNVLPLHGTWWRILISPDCVIYLARLSTKSYVTTVSVDPSLALAAILGLATMRHSRGQPCWISIGSGYRERVSTLGLISPLIPLNLTASCIYLVSQQMTQAISLDLWSVVDRKQQQEHQHPQQQPQ